MGMDGTHLYKEHYCDPRHLRILGLVSLFLTPPAQDAQVQGNLCVFVTISEFSINHRCPKSQQVQSVECRT
jgi:hypothetical protein